MDTFRIRNLSNRTITIRGNSGNYIHLAPGTSSGSIDEVEITGNAKIEKLTAAGLISKPIKEDKRKKKPESQAEVIGNEEKEITETESAES